MVVVLWMGMKVAIEQEVVVDICCNYGGSL